MLETLGAIKKVQKKALGMVSNLLGRSYEDKLGLDIFGGQGGKGRSYHNRMKGYDRIRARNISDMADEVEGTVV